MKLAWAFMNIMNVIHHYEILHNNLPKDNIMLHFQTNKRDVVYIRMCAWGDVECMQKVIPSLYAFVRTRISSTRGKCVGGWPQFFFVHGKLGIANSLSQMGETTLW